jgi:hypothetical protein
MATRRRTKRPQSPAKGHSTSTSMSMNASVSISSTASAPAASIHPAQPKMMCPGMLLERQKNRAHPSPPLTTRLITHHKSLSVNMRRALRKPSKPSSKAPAWKRDNATNTGPLLLSPVIVTLARLSAVAAMVRHTWRQAGRHAGIGVRERILPCVQRVALVFYIIWCASRALTTCVRSRCMCILLLLLPLCLPLSLPLPLPLSLPPLSVSLSLAVVPTHLRGVRRQAQDGAEELHTLLPATEVEYSGLVLFVPRHWWCDEHSSGGLARVVRGSDGGPDLGAGRRVGRVGWYVGR